VTEKKIPSLSRISDYVAWHAGEHPHAVALTTGEVALTYAELSRRVDALAKGLLAARVTKGSRVATLATPHHDFLIAFLAAASIGAIWVGLNPRYQLAELALALSDAEPAVLLTRTRIGEREYAPELESLKAASPRLRLIAFAGEPPLRGVEAMESFLKRGDAVSPEVLAAARGDRAARDPCLLVYTSGSSGTPKGALLHHEGIIASSLRQNELWPVTPMSLVNYFPINHIGCVVDCATPCLVAGGTLHFLEQFDPRRCLELMAHRRVTIWGSVPSAFQLQLELDEFASYDLSAVQLIAWGGAPMPIPLIERLRRISRNLATNYGVTETTGSVTSVEPTDEIDVLAHSVGQPVPGIEVRLRDAAGLAVPLGMAGEVQVRSPGNMIGYWRRPEASAAAFTADDFFRTGDLAIERPDGGYRLVGRLTDMFKSGGYNVYPREIEAVLEAHAAIALAAVVPVPDALWQEVGVAYVVAAAPVTPDELAAFCRSRLAAYKVPKRFSVVAALPLLPIGKVDKRSLRLRALSEART
jgi:acyl-CoA synthetase (AMP-forming)/AMP-acid ligase II